MKAYTYIKWVARVFYGLVFVLWVTMGVYLINLLVQ